MNRRPFSEAAVKAVFDGYPPAIRTRLLALRALIFDAASEAGVGDVIETLKWHQPAYLPKQPRTGTTIRIDALKEGQGGYAMYFHCQTTLIGTFREVYGEAFTFQGNRAMVFTLDDEIDTGALKHCIALALTYHSSKRTGQPE